MTRERSKIVLVLGLVALLLVTPELAQARPVPGVVTQTVLDDRDFARMERGGVETLRFLIRWREVEPEPGRLDWSSTDHVLASAARHGIEVLPIVYGSPAWVAQSELRPPIDDAADRASWRSFLTALVGRYGPRGTSGRARPARRSPAGRSGTSPTSTSTGTRSRPSASTRACSRSPPERSGPPIAARDHARRRRGGTERDAVVAVPAPALRAAWGEARLRLRRPASLRAGPAPDAAPDRARPADHGHGRRLADAARDHRGRLGVEGPASTMVKGPMRARLLKRTYRLLGGGHPDWRISDVQWYAWRDSMAVEAYCSFCQHAGLSTSPASRSPPGAPTSRQFAGVGATRG